jgi:hypothetical protein
MVPRDIQLEKAIEALYDDVVQTVPIKNRKLIRDWTEPWTSATELNHLLVTLTDSDTCSSCIGGTVPRDEQKSGRIRGLNQPQKNMDAGPESSRSQASSGRSVRPRLGLNWPGLD